MKDYSIKCVTMLAKSEVHIDTQLTERIVSTYHTQETCYTGAQL